jgi:RNA polymerase subunit RPABC4/transcription elongation factor Spt4
MAKAKEKACKICKTVYLDGDKCPKCDSKEFTESFKGKMFVMKPEGSEIAEKLGVKEKGEYAIKTR